MKLSSKQYALRLLAGTILATFPLGCGVARNPSARQLMQTELTGRVHGGQQPVTQANIQLFAVGTTGDGSTATSLMTKTVTTDGSGNFVLTGAYTCPTPTATFPGEVYLVASGGNPGLGSGKSNSQLTLFAALGACSNLGSNTFINVDEVTAIGSIAALLPYMTSATAIGSGASDAAALNAAMGTPLVDLSLTVGSAAIDSGTSTLVPATDFNGTARPQGKGYDRGAYEQ